MASHASVVQTFAIRSSLSLPTLSSSLTEPRSSTPASVHDGARTTGSGFGGVTGPGAGAFVQAQSSNGIARSVRIGGTMPRIGQDGANAASVVTP